MEGLIAKARKTIFADIKKTHSSPCSELPQPCLGNSRAPFCSKSKDKSEKMK